MRFVICVSIQSTERTYTLYAARHLPSYVGQGGAGGGQRAEKQAKVSSPRGKEGEGAGVDLLYCGKRRREGPEDGDMKRPASGPTSPRAQERKAGPVVEDEEAQDEVVKGEQEEERVVCAIVDFVVHAMDAELFGKLLEGLRPKVETEVPEGDEDNEMGL